MKKLITIALVALTFGAFAQAKTDTAKVKYDYFVKVPVRDYQQLMGVASDYAKQVKYNALMKADDKIAVQINLEKYLFDLPKSVKLDSVKVSK